MEVITQVPSNDKKPLWQSKTQWVSAIVALAPLVYPPAAVWIAANPELFSAALGLLFSGLRLVSKDKVVVK